MWTRRAALMLATAAVVSGCAGQLGADEGVSDSEGTCRTPGELVFFDRIGEAEVRYAENDAPTSLRAEPGFLAQMESWVTEWTELSGLGAMTSITSYGAFVDKCNSYHQIGQAFDVTAVEHEGGAISLRYDRFAPGTAQELRDYWRFAACTHLHFAYSLGYAYNEQHHNHIHFDNQASGSELSTFSQRSRSQIQLVQYGVRHIFGYEVEPSGSYDTATQEAVRAIQQDRGLTEPLQEPDGWHSFLRVLTRG